MARSQTFGVRVDTLFTLYFKEHYNVVFQFLATTQKLCREYASLFSIYIKAGVATIEFDWPKRKRETVFPPSLLSRVYICDFL